MHEINTINWLMDKIFCFFTNYFVYKHFVSGAGVLYGYLYFGIDFSHVIKLS